MRPLLMDTTVTESSSPNLDLSTLDTLTGGAFSAPTSGERAARLREWLNTQPDAATLQAVGHEMSVRDRGAAKVVRERLDELRRLKEQDALVQTWADKGAALRDAPRLVLGDALAWQRDAAKAGAPLSREPLAGLKQALAERVKAIEDLQHQAQVEREAAVLLAQRVEVLSTKSWLEAQAQREAVQTDLSRWQSQVQALMADAQWASVDPKFSPALHTSEQQLQAVWEAFDAALSAAQAASADTQAPLPAVPAWAEQIRQARAGYAPAAQAPAAPAAPTARIDASRTVKPSADKALIDAQRTELCERAEAWFKPVPVSAAERPPVATDDAAAVPTETTAVAESPNAETATDAAEAPAAAPDAAESEPAVRWEPVITGRKLQDSLRQLRETWKQVDRQAAPNPALWKRFDTACNRAHAVVDAWLKEVRAQSSAAKAQRLALIEEVKTWTVSVGQGPDWKRAARELHQFSQRWREGGHLSEKLFAELQQQWKTVIHAAHEPLEAAQKASLARRKALIDEAHTLAAEPRLRIDAVKALQQRWQEEAHSVPLDRRQEQKLWDAFRQPIDQAFANKSVARAASATKPSAPMSPHDQAVMQAAQALQAAVDGGDAAQIRAAMAALQAASEQRPESTAPRADASEAHAKAAAPAAAPAEASTSADPSTADATPTAGEGAEDTPVAGAETAADAAADAAPSTQEAPAAPAAPAAPVAKPRPVVAVRGDDRPGQKRPEAPAARGRDGKPARFGDPRDDRRFEGRGRDAREGRDDARGPRPPRLGDVAFRAQRQALESAQTALRKLAAQAHGEVLTQLLHAWSQRDAAQLPAAQALGGRLTPAQRTQWAQALQAAPAAPADTALLRLEMAAELPTPAAQLEARRALQLQLLTRRHDPAPTQTWASDAAQVLASAHDEANARRLQAALKVLLKR